MKLHATIKVASPMLLSFFLGFNIQRLNADEKEIRYQNFELFHSIIEKDYPERKFPIYDYAPTIMKEGDLFKMWWLGRSTVIIPDRQEDNIFYAESTNGINWSEPLNVMPPGHNNPSLYGYYVGNPSVIKVGDIYHMYISAGNGGQSALGESVPVNAIGYTTSKDGINWQDIKIILEPFLLKNICCGSYGAGEPSVVFLNGFFYMAYIDSTGQVSNPVNGSGVYMIRSSTADFSEHVEVVTGYGDFVDLTAENETQYLWKDNTNGGEFAWSDELESFLYLRGGTSSFLLADSNLKILQELEFPVPKNGWREENTFVRTPQGHLLDLGLEDGIDVFVVGGYVTPDVEIDSDYWPSNLDIWWTDFQAVRFTLLQENQSANNHLALRVKHLNNGCPQGYQTVASMAEMLIDADGYDLSDGQQSWVLCSLIIEESHPNLVTLKHLSNNCPNGYERIAFLENLYIKADGFDLEKPQYWMVCTLQKNGRSVVLLKDAKNDCPSSYTSSALLHSIPARADRVSFDPPRDWKLCTLSLDVE
ncbi:hypothetical protein Lepto7376_0020 [[Leptolyngbya] sp. PCC 7376]|nr:hypothetical protein Lepto7376_0020 [[Leptolyngbya] sp. PCC 7376]